MSSLSIIAGFDDLRRCGGVLTDGTAENEFLRYVNFQEEARTLWLNAVHEAQRLQQELDSALTSIAELERKLLCARRLLESETHLRKEMQSERNAIEYKCSAIQEILRNENNIRDETRSKLLGLSQQPRKRKSAAEKRLQEEFGKDINSTGSLLSDMSVTQSDDDFLNRSSSKYKKHRPSQPNTSGIFIGEKKSRISMDRRSGNINKHKHIEIGTNEKIVAHTRVTVPQDNGPILAESIIEAMPDNNQIYNLPSSHRSKSPYEKKSSMKPSDPCTPSAPPPEDTVKSMPKFIFQNNKMRQHQFTTKTFFRTELCTHCQKKIKFGSVAVKCRDCRVLIHNDCRELLKLSCVPITNGTPVKGVMSNIQDYTPNIGPMVPALIVHCVNEIETRGLNEVGIYRHCGSERDVKSLKEQFLRANNIPYLGNIDIHVLCGCIKDFLRSLKEPLIPTQQWKDFSNAVQNSSEDRKLRELYSAINKLPQANRDTLAFLLQHFQRVAENPGIKMPLENIAKIFGPTIVGYSSNDLDKHALYSETVIQFSVLGKLLQIPTDFWAKFINVEVEYQDQENNPLEKSYFGTPTSRTKFKKGRKYFDTPPTATKL